MGWGGVGNDVNVPWTYPHGGNISVSKHHKTFWKNFKKIWRSKSKCQNASSFRVHKKRTFVIEHNRMALTKREYQWNCAEKSRAAAWTPKTNGNTDSKLSKIQAMYWKHHGRLHTVYQVVCPNIYDGFYILFRWLQDRWISQHQQLARLVADLKGFKGRRNALADDRRKLSASNSLIEKLQQLNPW